MQKLANASRAANSHRDFGRGEATQLPARGRMAIITLVELLGAGGDRRNCARK